MNLQEVSTESLKALPSTTTIAFSFLGLPVEQWASLVAIAFIFLQAFFLIKEKWWDKRNKD